IAPPSKIKRGLVDEFKEPTPRITTVGNPPGAPELRETSTPATLPCKPSNAFVTGFVNISSAFTETTAPVTSILRCVTHHHYFLQLFFLGHQLYVNNSPRVQRHLLRLIAHKSENQYRLGLLYLKGIFPVCVCAGAVGSAFHRHVYAGQRFARSGVRYLARYLLQCFTRMVQICAGCRRPMDGNLRN